MMENLLKCQHCTVMNALRLESRPSISIAVLVNMVLRYQSVVAGLSDQRHARPALWWRDQHALNSKSLICLNRVVRKSHFKLKT